MAAAMEVDEEVPTTSVDKSGSKKRFEVKKVNPASLLDLLLTTFLVFRSGSLLI